MTYLQRIVTALLLTLYILVLCVVTGIQEATVVYAETCYEHSLSWWYPGHVTYSDSYVYEYGQAQGCWYPSGDYYMKGYSYGSQYPNVPLSRIRATVDSWEENPGNCGTNWTADSGWKYGVYSVTALTSTHYWICTGGNHSYVSHVVNYFGDSVVFDTGYH